MIARFSLALLAAAAVTTTGAAAQQLDVANPTWSPNGKQIAYTVASSPRQRLVTAAATGTGARTLTAMDSCCEPIRWAASGRIVFSSNYTIWSIPGNGGSPTKIADGSNWFILSPNLETVAFIEGCDCGHAPDAVGIVGVRGGAPVIVPRPDGVSDEIDGFSPDGTEVVFTRYPFNTSGSPVVMVEHVSGGDPVPLASSGLIGSSFVPAGAERVQWSPDGRWIAFVLDFKLEVVSTAGGTARVLATKFGPHAFSWSPKSTRLAFDESFSTKHVAWNSRLVTVDPRGQHRVVLWKDAAFKYVSDDSLDWPQWSPDGTKLVFMGIRGRSRPPAHIWVIGADGRGLQRVA